VCLLKLNGNPLGNRLVLAPFSVHDFRGKSIRRAALETEVSPSNFTFAAKDIVCYPRVQPAAKLKFERLTFTRCRTEI
jgi:hypothetical protein